MITDDAAHCEHSVTEQPPKDFDLERYVAMLDEPGMTDDQKRSFVGALQGMFQNLIIADTFRRPDLTHFLTRLHPIWQDRAADTPSHTLWRIFCSYTL